jgi:hypothetical protein
MRPSVSKLKIILCFPYTRKKKVVACILILITSLLKSREHWPKFQKQQKIYFVLISGITNLYVKRISNIKKVFSFDNIEQLGFTAL